jgi:hypothetical protein
VSVYVEVNQHAPDLRHVVHRVEVMRMCSMIAADDDAERGGTVNVA